jgi:uncharacterized protein (DUF488 family)
MVGSGPQSVPSQPPLLSIGYGNTRSTDEFVDLLHRYSVQYLVDVRSKPFSKFRPEFSRDALAAILARAGLRYVFMGDSLGGLPSDSAVYTDGKVDYLKCREKQWFKDGLARLDHAYRTGQRLSIMCSELEPERCHRSKLIGDALSAINVPLFHIDERGELISQQAALARIDGGQAPLFGLELTSRKRYEPDPREGEL